MMIIIIKHRQSLNSMDHANRLVLVTDHVAQNLRFGNPRQLILF